MNYIASLTDFFKSPKWMMNLLLAGLCCLIPILGWMVVLGWVVMGLWGREDESMETFPDFDFKKFTIYLEKGLWPFLVMLAVGVAGMIAAKLIDIILGGIGGMFFGYGHHHGGVLAFLYGMFLLTLNMILKVVVLFITVPLVIRATLLQDFVKAFDVTYVKRFLTAMWMETLLASLVCMAASLILFPAGVLLICVGVGLAFALMFFMQSHLNKQLYVLFISRGGEPIPVSPRLMESSTPPPPPAPPMPPAV